MYPEARWAMAKQNLDLGRKDFTLFPFIERHQIDLRNISFLQKKKKLLK